MRNKQGDLKTQVKRLINLADYQTDSIVSRTLIDKKNGTVTFLPLLKVKH